MKEYFLGAIFTIFSSVALAKPIYLECEVSSEKETQLFSAKIDEDTGKVTHSQPGGFSFNTDGFFAADKIAYQIIDLSDGLKIVRRFDISRIDLSATFITEMSSVNHSDKIPTKTFNMAGKCKLIEVKERVF